LVLLAATSIARAEDNRVTLLGTGTQSLEISNKFSAVAFQKHLKAGSGCAFATSHFV